MLRRAFVSLLFSWQVVPRRILRAVSLALCSGRAAPAARHLLRSSPQPGPAAAAPHPGGGRRRLCARPFELWWLQRRGGKTGEGRSERTKEERRRQQKATSDGKLVRTGAVGKNGKVDRRLRWHKSVSARGARQAAAGSDLGWRRGAGRSYRCAGARRRREGAPRTPPPVPTPSWDFGSSHLAAELPPQPQPQGGAEQKQAEQPAPAPGTWGSQGVVFGSEEVPAQPSKFCPKADKRIAPR